MSHTCKASRHRRRKHKKSDPKKIQIGKNPGEEKKENLLAGLTTVAEGLPLHC
jgi:hypothetical protein